MVVLRGMLQKKCLFAHGAESGCVDLSGLVKSINIFSKHWPSGPMLSISRNDHLCVCVSVCVSVNF